MEYGEPVLIGTELDPESIKILLNKMKELRPKGLPTAPQASKDNSILKSENKVGKTGINTQYFANMINDFVIIHKPPSQGKTSRLDESDRLDETNRLDQTSRLDKINRSDHTRLTKTNQ